MGKRRNDGGGGPRAKKGRSNAESKAGNEVAPPADKGKPVNFGKASAANIKKDSLRAWEAEAALLAEVDSESLANFGRILLQLGPLQQVANEFYSVNWEELDAKLKSAGMNWPRERCVAALKFLVLGRLALPSSSVEVDETWGRFDQAFFECLPEASPAKLWLTEPDWDSKPQTYYLGKFQVQKTMREAQQQAPTIHQVGGPGSSQHQPSAATISPLDALMLSNGFGHNSLGDNLANLSTIPSNVAQPLVAATLAAVTAAMQEQQAKQTARAAGPGVRALGPAPAAGLGAGESPAGQAIQLALQQARGKAQPLDGSSTAATALESLGPLQDGAEQLLRAALKKSSGISSRVLPSSQSGEAPPSAQLNGPELEEDK